MEIDVNIKLLEDGIIPVYKTEGSAGADCFSRVDAVIKSHETKVIPLGFEVEIPVGYEMQMRPRSGLGLKGKVAVFGTIDSDYRGEVGAIIHNNTQEDFIVSKGDRVSQAVVAPVTIAKFNPVLLLSETQRGSGGFGSTGK